MEKTLVILDASALSNSACMLKLFRTVVQGYTSKLNSNDIEFGTAFHKFRRIFRDKGENGLALGIKVAKEHFINTPSHVKSNKQYLTPNFLMRICLEYAAKYVKDPFQVIRIKDNTEALLELKFAFPYYVDDDMEILIAGTIDELGKHSNGITCICDAKTTAMWDVKKYFTSYELSCQLRFYKWALLQYIKAYPNSFLAEICKDEIGCMIDGIFYKGKDQEVIYQRSDVMLYNDDKDMLEMDRLIRRKVNDLIITIINWRGNSIFPLREGILIGACETRYDLCTFSRVCAAVDETTRDVMLDYDFIKKQYNPLTHGD